MVSRFARSVDLLFSPQSFPYAGFPSSFAIALRGELRRRSYLAFGRSKWGSAGTWPTRTYW